MSGVRGQEREEDQKEGTAQAEGVALGTTAWEGVVIVAVWSVIRQPQETSCVQSSVVWWHQAAWRREPESMTML